MNEFAITAIGQDRPGIVAGFTGVLLELGCNLEDCSMSLLREEFAMILLVSVPDGVSGDRLDAALREPARSFDLLVTTRQVHDVATHAESAPFVISVYGKDKPGIVHAIAMVLAEDGVNITDLRSHLAGEDLYAMILDVAVPPSVDPSHMADRLVAAAEQLSVALTIRSAEAAEL